MGLGAGANLTNEFLEVPEPFKRTNEIPWENIGAFKLIRKFQEFFENTSRIGTKNANLDGFSHIH